MFEEGCSCEPHRNTDPKPPCEQEWLHPAAAFYRADASLQQRVEPLWALLSSPSFKVPGARQVEVYSEVFHAEINAAERDAEILVECWRLQKPFLGAFVTQA